MDYPEETLGDKIRKIRNIRGLTAEGLGDLCNYSMNTIYSYESDATLPGLDFMKKITQVLDVDISYFEDDYFTFISSDNYVDLLYNWRKENTITRKDLEEKLNIFYYTYLKWEEGSKLSRESFNKIKKELDIYK